MTFKPLDPEVLILARVFTENGWRWHTKDGAAITPYVPDAVDIAKTLAMLEDSAMWGRTEHLKKCRKCKAGDGYYCRSRPRFGASETGRLFVRWSDDDYGPDVSFGLTFNLGPELFR